MDITDLLSRTGGLGSMARELGVDESQAVSGAQALLPSILGGFQRQAGSSSGDGGGLGGLLSQLGGGGLLDNVLSPEPTDVGRGNDVLGSIFGSKNVSRAVAQDASTRSGLDPSLLKRMLPMLAMMVAGYMAKQRGGAAGSSQGGGLGDILGGMLGGGRSADDTGGALGGMLGGGRSADDTSGALGGMLGGDRGGNPLDDILKSLGRR